VSTPPFISPSSPSPSVVPSTPSVDTAVALGTWSPQDRLQILVDAWTSPRPDEHEPAAIGVEWFEAELKLTVIPLGADDPVSHLATIETPERWDAFGIVTRGTATSLRADDDINERVRVAVLVDRTGRTASAVRTVDGGVLFDGTTDLTEGRIPDACRRVLGLPTGPSPAAPFSLLALQWADALAELGASAPGSVTWADALAARPFDPRSTWTELRLGVASDALQLPGITSDLATFMDDGMFAREAVASSPSPGHLFEILSATVPRHVLERLVDHLDDLADDLDLR
jgi:hypothetical protein